MARANDPLSEPDRVTFGTKLEQMRVDLCSIVDRMNRDRSEDVAMVAQTALMAVVSIQNEADGRFSDFEWDWQPEGTNGDTA